MYAKHAQYCQNNHKLAWAGAEAVVSKRAVVLESPTWLLGHWKKFRQFRPLITCLVCQQTWLYSYGSRKIIYLLGQKGRLVTCFKKIVTLRSAYCYAFDSVGHLCGQYFCASNFANTGQRVWSTSSVLSTLKVMDEYNIEVNPDWINISGQVQRGIKADHFAILPGT